jgi:hypothetical protein
MLHAERLERGPGTQRHHRVARDDPEEVALHLRVDLVEDAHGVLLAREGRPDELDQLATRQSELAGRRYTDCPVSAPLSGLGDGLPPEGATTLDHVRQTMARFEPTIRQDFAGVLSLSVEPRNGEVWRGKRGDFTVHRAHDYWIVVHVEAPIFCPSAPAAFRSYDGVPLHFVVG